MAAKRDFTDRFLKAIKPAAPGKRDIYMDAVVPQFGIRVGDKSCKEHIGAFVLVGRFPGSSNPVPRRIGDYPAMSLADARAIAREWREDIARGVDPKKKEALRCHEAARRRADTFAAVFDAYTAERLSRLRTGEGVQSAIKRYVLPAWGERPLKDIRRADVKALIREIHKKTPIAGNRVLSYLKTFLAWCADEEIIDASPAAGVKPIAEEPKRDRVLSDSEIRALWLACEKLGAFGRCFRFLLVSGQRLSEVGGMRWSEIDEGARLWRIPRERAKADRAHEVPLSDIALAILAECPRLGPFVFTTRGDVPLAGWSKAKSRLDRLMLERLQKAANERGDTAPVILPDWRLHDLRRTCATNLARLGVDRIVISKLLNHAEGGVTSVYDRHARDPEKRAAMERWAQRLQSIVKGSDGGNVVPIAQARG
jgi:integrase